MFCGAVTPFDTAPAAADPLAPVQPWPKSQTAAQMEARTASRARGVAVDLLRLHTGRLVAEGWRGAQSTR